MACSGSGSPTFPGIVLKLQSPTHRSYTINFGVHCVKISRMRMNHRDLKKIWKIKCTKIERQIYFLFPLNFLRSYKSKWYQVIHIGRQLSDLQVPCAQRGPAIQHRPSRLPESCIDGWPAFKDQNGSNDWGESPILPSMDPIGLEVPRDHKM